MTIRIISRPLHAVLDYVSGAVMLASPWILGFTGVDAARNVMIGLGATVLAMSMLTNYEGGIFKKIAMSTHLWGDLFIGIFLAAAPWLLFFDNEVYIPHLVIGLFSITASLLTVNTSQVKRHRSIDFVEGNLW
ncbi:SPW repeat-containing protein [Parapedobacter composti]|uniref:SPW repeat-containing protein n=1 Tax=Parapedobacter composti TaxID=623281 RepID=A0A1I1IG82_9SPHI|nr:SPW repeat protein [Parapedobacter composti]SFC35297.1 SPW repeat-containing protein [Parapedobacter composti]